MGRVNYIQTSFTAGELSPRLYGQVNLDKYRNGCRTIENFIIMPHGGLTRRPGTYFVQEVKDSTKTTRLLPFEFSTEQTYIIEFGHNYFRFYKDNGIILDAGNPYEVAHTYTEAQLFEVQFTQSADVMYLVHKDHPPRKLSRTGHTNWTLTDIVYTDGPYMPINKVTANTITPSATSGTGITLTASTATFVSTDVGRFVRIKHSTTWGYAKITAFTSTTVVTADVKTAFGATTASGEWRLGAWSATSGYPGSVCFYEERLFYAGSKSEPQTIWGSKSGDYDNMTPGTEDEDAVTYTIASDQVNAIVWLSPGQILVAGTTGGEFSISSSDFKAQPITPSNVRVRRESAHGSRAVRPVRTASVLLFVQGAGKKVREFTYSFENDGYVAPDLTLLAEHITGSGVVESAFQAQPDGVYWAARQDGMLLGMTYLRDQAVIGWHRHNLGGTNAAVKSLAVIKQDTFDELWLIVERTIGGTTKKYVEYLTETYNGQGKFDAFFVDSGLSYDGTQNTALNMNTEIAGTGRTFTAATPVFSAGNVGDQIWEINGPGRATITGYTSTTVVTCTINTHFTAASVASGNWAIAVESVSGLEHLNGQTVQILGNGAVHTEKVVASGTVALDVFAYKVCAGLGYNSIVESLDAEAGSVIGSSAGTIGRTHEIYIRVYETLGGKFGYSTSDTLDNILYRSSAVNMGSSPDLYSGFLDLSFPKGWERSRRVCIEQTQPLPMTILALVQKITVSDA